MPIQLFFFTEKTPIRYYYNIKSYILNLNLDFVHTDKVKTFSFAHRLHNKLPV